ncbi:MAG: hypothetical protein J5482_02840 [Oscillospiraceae bacterium]|nr:hypothetical protein [Oscillospiraceae bacterium]
MKEYIEREAVLDTLAKDDLKRTDEEKVAVLYCYDRIKKVPAADVVEVRHGKWIIRNSGAYGQTQTFCSVCKKHSGIGSKRQTPPYCPKCGAKMDGGGIND